MLKLTPHIQKIGLLKGHEGAVYMLAHNLKGTHFISGGSDRLAVSWNLQGMNAEKVLAKSDGVIYSAFFFQDGNRLAMANDQGKIHIIDLLENKEIQCLQPSNAAIFDIIHDTLNNRLIAASGDGILSFWDLSTYKCEKRIKLTDVKLRQLAFHPSGKLLAVASGSNEIALIAPETMNLINRFTAHSMSVNALCFHPNGRFLLSGSRDAYLKVWDIENDFQLFYEVAAHNFAIYSLVFSPDGSMFATASRDKTIKLWDAEKFDFLKRIDKQHFDGHVNSVNKLLWLNDFLISTGDDKTIMIWDVLC